MQNELTKVALIPAFEPGEAFIELISGLRDAGFQCVAVDDGSGGDYAEIFGRASRLAVVLTHGPNRG